MGRPLGPPWTGFEEWATAQFGQRPEAPTWQELHEAEGRAAAMRRAYEAQQKWDTDTHAALYAWNVRDSDKLGKVVPRGK